MKQNIKIEALEKAIEEMRNTVDNGTTYKRGIRQGLQLALAFIRMMEEMEPNNIH